MHVVVCAKLVPHADVPQRLDQVTGRINRDGEAVLDDSDTFGVEMGLRLVEQAGGGEVTVLTMAPDTNVAPLRTALAMGASRAVLVSDPALGGSDALSTAKVLAAALRGLGADLVLAATESTDGYTGTVPVQVAELLALPSVSFARKVDLAGDALVVERQTEDGYDEVTCPLPAVVTVTAGVVEVRYPSIRGIMSAKAKPIDVMSLTDLGVDPSTVGVIGAREQVIDVTAAPGRVAGQTVTDDGTVESEIISLLESLKVL